MAEPNPQPVQVTDHDEGQEPQERQVINALSLLRAPEKSDLARKRKISSNDPCKNRNTRLVHAKTATAPNVSPAARIREFPDECFNNSAQDKKGAISCEAYREEVSVKRSTIMCHIKSQKHLSGKERLRQKAKRERDLAEVLRTYDDRNHPKGETFEYGKQGISCQNYSCLPEGWGGH